MGLNMHSKDKQYYFDCITKAINLYWRTLGKARDMEIHTGDIEYVMSKSRRGPERVFNVRLPSETADQLINEIITNIKDGVIPDSFLITPNTTPDNLTEILVQKGFSIDTSGLCMAMDLADLQCFQYNSEIIQVSIVEDIDDLRKWTDIINIALCGCEIMSFEQFYDIYCHDNTQFFLALYDGIPAAVSMTIIEDDIATLEFVATLKEYRNKGLGTLVAASALEYLQKNSIKTVSLRAEPNAINLYKKLGFKEFCKRVVASCNL